MLSECHSLLEPRGPVGHIYIYKFLCFLVLPSSGWLHEIRENQGKTCLFHPFKSGDIREFGLQIWVATLEQIPWCLVSLR